MLYCFVGTETAIVPFFTFWYPTLVVGDFPDQLAINIDNVKIALPTWIHAYYGITT